MKLFDEYPCLTDGNVQLRKMKEPDAKRLDEIAGKVCIYETLPTFLYELRYEEKIRTIRAMDEVIRSLYERQ